VEARSFSLRRCWAGLRGFSLRRCGLGAGRGALACGAAKLDWQAAGEHIQRGKAWKKMEWRLSVGSARVSSFSRLS